MVQKNILSAAVAACFGVVAGQALAVVDLSATTVTGINKYAKEIPGNTTSLLNAANQHDVKIKVPAGYAITSSNPLYVKINLTNGAQFVTTPALSCVTDGASTTAGLVTLGGASTSYVVFNVGTVADTSTSAGAGAICSATMGASTTISGLNTVAVSATVEYKNGLNNTVTGVASNYITFVRGVSGDIISADGSVIVDATSGSDNLTLTSNRASMWLGTLGQVKFAAVGTSAASAATVGNITEGALFTTAFVTITGPAVGVALAANGNSGIFLDAAASACTTKSYTVSASATNSVTFNNVATADLAAGLNVCINVSGNTTVIPTGQFSAAITGTAVANVTADFSSASDKLETITSNGTTKNAYLVNASTSTAKTSVLRIVNTGAVSAVFTATAYAVDSLGDATPVAKTTLGTAGVTLGTIVSGGALSFTSAQLESVLGFTPGTTSTKYRVVISAGTDAMEILNFTRDVATGAITLSQSQTN